MWGDAAELGFHLIAHVECFHKFGNAFCIHHLVGASECLQRFVWLWIALTAQNGLHSLSHHAPHAVEVGIDGVEVEDKLVQALQCAGKRNHHVPHWHTHVAKHRRVGEIALEA